MIFVVRKRQKGYFILILKKVLTAFGTNKGKSRKTWGVVFKVRLANCRNNSEQFCNVKLSA